MKSFEAETGMQKPHGERPDIWADTAILPDLPHTLEEDLDYRIESNAQQKTNEPDLDAVANRVFQEKYSEVDFHNNNRSPVRPAEPSQPDKSYAPPTLHVGKHFDTPAPVRQVAQRIPFWKKIFDGK